MRVVESYLTPTLRQRLGAPDVRLVVGGAAFPVHARYISAQSGVLCDLLRSCGGGNPPADITLNAPASAGGGGAGGAAAFPEAATSEAAFERFLRALYGAGAQIASFSDARELVELAAYYDAPRAVGAADAYLAGGPGSIRGRPAELPFIQYRIHVTPQDA